MFTALASSRVSPPVSRMPAGDTSLPGQRQMIFLQHKKQHRLLVCVYFPRSQSHRGSGVAQVKATQAMNLCLCWEPQAQDTGVFLNALRAEFHKFALEKSSCLLYLTVNKPAFSCRERHCLYLLKLFATQTFLFYFY